MATGSLRAQFDINCKMDILDLSTNEHNEYIPRSSLIQAAAESPEIKLSPSASKSGNKKNAKAQKQQPPDNQPPQVKIPGSVFHDFGTTPGVWQFLEVKPFEFQLPLSQLTHSSSSLKSCPLWSLYYNSHNKDHPSVLQMP